MKGISGKSRGLSHTLHIAYIASYLAESERYLSLIIWYNNNWEKILTIDILRLLIISICAPNFFSALPPSGTNFQEACSVNVTSSCLRWISQHDQNKCGTIRTRKCRSTNWLANYMLSIVQTPPFFLKGQGKVNFNYLPRRRGIWKILKRGWKYGAGVGVFIRRGRGGGAGGAGTSPI